MQNSIIPFEDHNIRRIYDEKAEKWYFSVVDIIQVLTQQADFQTARKYWNKLKERLDKEGSQTVTNCHQLKMRAEDGKMRLTDVADPETLLRLIQSFPIPHSSFMHHYLNHLASDLHRKRYVILLTNILQIAFQVKQ
jgi:hypothetical protein